jgi:glycosyltransferase involved in cell wall biosynthesis
MLSENIRKYSERFGIDGWEFFPYNLENIFKNIVVIPALDETDNIRKLIKSLKVGERRYYSTTLFIFVINNCKSAADEVKMGNKASIDYLKEEIEEGDIPIAFVDAASEGKELHDKEGGVGLARKIGMDLSLNFFNYKSPEKNILICLDADCTVGDNYITTIVEEFNNNSFNAASIYFEHPFPVDELNTAAIITYEIFLRYYVSCLRFAGSEYAFHTVGSSMASTAEAYIKTEGMNKKKAAEDFYFLEKLSKNYTINEINNTVVYPSARGSARVPFGTGQRVNRFLEGKRDEYYLYDFESFIKLSEWLQIYYSLISPEEMLEKCRKAGSPVIGFLKENNFLEQLNSIYKTSKELEQLKGQKRRWFDGFRTLKLIHYLRDNAFSPKTMFSEVSRLLEVNDVNFQNYGGKIPHLEVQKECLMLLRDLQRKN